MVTVLSSGLAALSGNAIFAQKISKTQTTLKGNLKSAESSVENSKVIIRVVGVQDLGSEENTFENPTLGNKFIAVQVIVDNIEGTEDWDVSPAFFKLKDWESNVYDPSLFSSLISPSLVSGIVDGGDLVKGWITFEVSKDIEIKTLKFRYEYSGYKSGWIFLAAVK